MHLHWHFLYSLLGQSRRQRNGSPGGNPLKRVLPQAPFPNFFVLLPPRTPLLEEARVASVRGATSTGAIALSSLRPTTPTAPRSAPEAFQGQPGPRKGPSA